MQPVYDTVRSLLVEINHGVSRYTPSNISAAGCAWECRGRTSSRRPAGLLAPRQRWLSLTCAGSHRARSCRHWAGRRRCLKPGLLLSSHNILGDRTKLRGPTCLSPPQGCDRHSAHPHFLPRGGGYHLLGRTSPLAPGCLGETRTTYLLIFHSHFNPQIPVQTKVYSKARIGLV